MILNNNKLNNSGPNLILVKYYQEVRSRIIIIIILKDFSNIHTRSGAWHSEHFILKYSANSFGNVMLYYGKKILLFFHTRFEAIIYGTPRTRARIAEDMNKNFSCLTYQGTLCYQLLLFLCWEIPLIWVHKTWVGRWSGCLPKAF